MSINPIFLKGLGLAVLVILLDQATKFYILGALTVGIDGRVIILPFFNLVLVWNKGISFGMFHNFAHAQALFSVAAILIVALLVGWLYKAEDRLSGLALGLIIGGAAGNIFDRIAFGSVVDFLDFHIGAYHWPAFNIADSAVCVGAFLLIFHGFFANKKQPA